MKRLITMLALMLVLLSFAWGAVLSAELDDPDDHTWGGETSGEPGQYRHTNGGIELATTGIFAIDLLLYEGISYKKLQSLFDGDSRFEDFHQHRDDRLVYNDRTRHISLK